MNRISKSPPWYTYVHELYELFRYDDDISFMNMDSFDEKVKSGDESPVITVTMAISNREKMKALAKIIPSITTFGNVKVCIDLLDASPETTEEDIYRAAFKHNPIVDQIFSKEGVGGTNTYVEFSPYVRQFYDDNIASASGYTSMLPEQIARDVLTKMPVFFSSGKVPEDSSW